MHKCLRCLNGQLLLEVENISCKKCKESGASVCGNCIKEFTWNCLQCGWLLTAATVKRKDMQSYDLKDSLKSYERLKGSISGRKD